MKNLLFAMTATLALCGCQTTASSEAVYTDTAGLDKLDSGFTGFVPLGKLRHRDQASVVFPRPGALVLKVCTRCADEGEDGAIYFREIEIAPDGRIQRISTETDGMALYTNQ